MFEEFNETIRGAKEKALSSYYEYYKLLNVIGNNHGYDFINQLSIYNKKPSAIACANVQTWNKHFNANINHDSTEIPVIMLINGEKHIIPIFDVSDTNLKFQPRWEYEKELDEKHLNEILNSFGIEQSNDPNESLRRLAVDIYSTANNQELKKFKKHPEKEAFEDFISKSLANVLSQRFKLDYNEPDRSLTEGILKQLNTEDLEIVGNFYQSESSKIIKTMISKDRTRKQNEKIAKQQKTAEVIAFYENNISPTNARVERTLRDWIDQVDIEIVKAAIDRASDYGAKSVNYVSTILNNWQSKGLNTLDKVESYLNDYDQKVSQRYTKQEKQYVEVVPQWLKDRQQTEAEIEQQENKSNLTEPEVLKAQLEDIFQDNDKKTDKIKELLIEITLEKGDWSVLDNFDKESIDRELLEVAVERVISNPKTGTNAYNVINTLKEWEEKGIHNISDLIAQEEKIKNNEKNRVVNNKDKNLNNKDNKEQSNFQETKQYTYTPIRRPIGIGTVPNGFVKKDNNYVNSKGREYGSVTYDRKLSEAEIDAYELEEVKTSEKNLEGFKEVKAIIAVGVGTEFILADKDKMENIELNTTPRDTVLVNNNEYDLYIGSTYEDSRKIDKLLDSGQHKIYSRNKHSINQIEAIQESEGTIYTAESAKNAIVDFINKETDARLDMEHFNEVYPNQADITICEKTTPDNAYKISYKINLDAKEWSQTLNNHVLETVGYGKDAFKEIVMELNENSKDELLRVDSKNLRDKFGLEFDESGNIFQKKSNKLELKREELAMTNITRKRR